MIRNVYSAIIKKRRGARWQERFTCRDEKGEFQSLFKVVKVSDDIVRH